MNQILRRPSTRFSPENGLLRNDHFQIAYVTNDLTRAGQIFRDRYGIKEYQRVEGQIPAGGSIAVDLAWVGGVMYELVQASGAGSDFYNERLPLAGFAIRHHHLGYFIHNEADWQALEDEIERGGWKVMFQAAVPKFMRVYYIEAPELGHFLEYIYPEAAGITFFEDIPSC